jgi:heme-degrading monooxygenase HmoA
MEWSTPYIAVIFSTNQADDVDGYAAMATQMAALAAKQPGYLGHESVSDDKKGITISYWVDEAASLAWRKVVEHVVAQRLGRARWYDSYDLRVATVTRASKFNRLQQDDIQDT